MLISSSISGDTNTAANEVCRRAPESTVSVAADHVHRGALDPGDLAGRDLDQLGLEAAALAPAQVHAQQHLRPILGLGAAGTGLDVEKGAAGVGLAREHARELQALRPLFHLAQLGVNVDEHVRRLVFLRRHRQQFVAVGKRAIALLQRRQDFLETRLLATQCLRALGILAPDFAARQFGV
jgi:hypothetical protein